MMVFIDTEFTDFVRIGLISIALVAEDGFEFYAERTDYCEEDCNDFVRAEILPMLGRIHGAACAREDLTQRLRAWFEALPEPATLMCDYASDWELLIDALLGNDYDTLPLKVGEKRLLGNSVLNDPVFLTAQAAAYTPDWRRHHALADARALRAGYLAWHASMEQAWSAR